MCNSRLYNTRVVWSVLSVDIKLGEMAVLRAGSRWVWSALLPPQTKLQQYCFLVFLVISVLVAVYIFLVVPETKNKTFLEIQTEFQSGEKRKASKADHSPRTTMLSTPLWNTAPVLLPHYEYLPVMDFFLSSRMFILCQGSWFWRVNIMITGTQETTFGAVNVKSRSATYWIHFYKYIGYKH